MLDARTGRGECSCSPFFSLRSAFVTLTFLSLTCSATSRGPHRPPRRPSSPPTPDSAFGSKLLAGAPPPCELSVCVWNSPSASDVHFHLFMLDEYTLVELLPPKVKGGGAVATGAPPNKLGEAGAVGEAPMWEDAPARLHRKEFPCPQPAQ